MYNGSAYVVEWYLNATQCSSSKQVICIPTTPYSPYPSSSARRTPSHAAGHPAKTHHHSHSYSSPIQDEEPSSSPTCASHVSDQANSVPLSCIHIRSTPVWKGRLWQAATESKNQMQRRAALKAEVCGCFFVVPCVDINAKFNPRYIGW